MIPFHHKPSCSKPELILKIYETWRIATTDCRLMVPHCPECQRRPMWIIPTGLFRPWSLARYLETGNVPRGMGQLFIEACNTNVQDVCECLGVVYNTFAKYEKDGFPKTALAVMEFILRGMHRGIDNLEPKPDCKALRTFTGLSIREWSNVLGVADQTVRRWEQGHTPDHIVGFYNLMLWNPYAVLAIVKRPVQPVPQIIEIENMRNLEPIK